jgi:putative DNA primase/helicase
MNNITEFNRKYFPKAVSKGDKYAAMCPVCKVGTVKISYIREAKSIVLSCSNSCEPIQIIKKKNIEFTDLFLQMEKAYPVKNYEDRFIDNTDLGNGYRFANINKGKCIYVPEQDAWYLWNGKYWKRDAMGDIHLLCNDVIEYMINEERHEEGKDHVLKWAITTKNGSHIEKMLKRASVLPEMKKSINEFDINSNLLTLKNGTINLKTGKMHEHDRGDYITKYIDIDFNPAAECDEWMGFLMNISCDNPDLIEFFRIALGYTLTGEVSEECLFFMYGKGSNGKSTFMNVIKEIFRDFYLKLSSESIMSHNISSANSKPYELADIKGKRFVLVSEVDTGDKLKESIIKDMTSRDTMQARQIRERAINFEPTHKLWMYGNHKPKISGTDDGIWRRIKLIPFQRKFEDHEKILNFDKILLSESEGILNWLISGAVDWYQKGLPKVKIIEDATNRYRKDQDNIAYFVSDCCEINPVAQVKAKNLFNEYKIYCKNFGESALGRNEFYSAIREKYEVDQRRGSGNATIFTGIGLNHEEAADFPY